MTDLARTVYQPEHPRFQEASARVSGLPAYVDAQRSCNCPVELTTKKLRRSAHRSVPALNKDIRAWIDTWNDDPRPYVWAKTADQILESITRYCITINDSGH